MLRSNQFNSNKNAVDDFQLLKRLNHRGNLHAVPASLKGKYVIRFTVTSTRTTSDDIIKDWNEIRVVASEILEECNAKIDKRIPLKGSVLKFNMRVVCKLCHKSKNLNFNLKIRNFAFKRKTLKF